MPVRPTPFGHIGLFPEQAENWSWLQREQPMSSESSLVENTGGSHRKALNLFAYTGASTMALIAAGYEVAHVDAAKANVQSAKLAAQLNGWSEAPIRYLVDDAAKFAARELRRQSRYQTLVLDPPAYGHSPKGKAWRLERDLWPLLDNLWELKTPSDFRFLVSGHSPEINETHIETFFRGKQKEDRSLQLEVQATRSRLMDLSGRHLDAGFSVRVTGTRS